MAASQSNPGKSLDWEEVSLATRPGVKARRERLLKDLEVPGYLVLSQHGLVAANLNGQVKVYSEDGETEELLDKHAIQYTREKAEVHQEVPRRASRKTR